LGDVHRSQPAILAPVFPAGHFLVLGQKPGADVRDSLHRLADIPIGERTVVALGEPLALAAGASVPRLRCMPALGGPGCAFPSTQASLWVFLGGDDAGELVHRARAFTAELADAFHVEEDVPAFRYAGGRDLSGYEDGTENPKAENAVAAAIVSGVSAELDGSSFVAWQRWVHDLTALDRMTQDQKDHVVGRRRDTNEEIADAPAYAHVKRSAQESFDPPAFMVRRSMPWGNAREHGLCFVAYGASLDAFERVLRRMAGLEDGVVDGLLRFSRAASGGYYWCPPLSDGRLDLRALALSSFGRG
jgi:putative iron-dependent peroxidase